MKALIDGDILVYRSSWVCQKTHWTHKDTGEFFDGKMKAKTWFKDICPEQTFDEDEWDVVEEIEPWRNCKFLLNNYVYEILKNTHSDEQQIFLTKGKCFRHDVAVTQPYKANRPPPPHHKDQAVKYLEEKWRAVHQPQLEADDLLGLNQTTETIIASVDKDLYMIPGLHYDIVKKEINEFDLLAADDWFFMQLIMGDRTDNIKGLSGTRSNPGLGKAGAEKIMREHAGDTAGLVRTIEQLYKERYGDDEGTEVMIEHAQLVYILRKGDEPGKEQWRDLLMLKQ